MHVRYHIIICIVPYMYHQNNSFRKRNFSSKPRYQNNRFQRSNKRKKITQQIDRALYVSSNAIEPQVTNEFVPGSFDKFAFNEQLAYNLKRNSFETTTEIQEKTIPLIQAGQDVLGISQTGSGKTAAFLLPTIDKLIKDSNQKALIVVPTRELAYQIAKQAIQFVKGSRLRVSTIIGGEPIGRQVAQLNRGWDIMIGTPGRINDLIMKNVFQPNEINTIVLDEVDRMLDMGFVDDIQKICHQLRPSKQSLFFSATLNKKIELVIRQLSSGFQTVKLSQNIANNSVLQDIVQYSDNIHKIDLLKGMLDKDDFEKTLIFVETKRYADMVYRQLAQHKFKVDVIHGDKRQFTRKKVIDMFRYSRINVLVATSVAARGIDIHDITHVINLDEPQSYDDYIHRIGRTGRNGKLGKAFTFVKASA